jgi:hypothetical protein
MMHDTLFLVPSLQPLQLEHMASYRYQPGTLTLTHDPAKPGKKMKFHDPLAAPWLAHVKDMRQAIGGGRRDTFEDGPAELTVSMQQQRVQLNHHHPKFKH